jgi:hypothetical protein
VVPVISQKGENRHSSATITPENTVWEPLQPRNCQGQPSIRKSLSAGHDSVAPYRSFPPATPVTDRRATAIRLYYGLDGDPRTLLQVGRIMRLTRERVRQYIASGRLKMWNAPELRPERDAHLEREAEQKRRELEAMQRRRAEAEAARAWMRLARSRGAKGTTREATDRARSCNMRRRPRAAYRPPPADDPADFEHTAVDVPEGGELDPELAARLATEGWQEVHRGRLGWFGAAQGERIYFRRPRALAPMRVRRRRG